jgi:hypothetical protein
MQIRRVVTGHNELGEAVFVDDGYIDPTTVALSTTAYHELWRADEAPTFPDAGARWCDVLAGWYEPGAPGELG